MVRNPRLNGNGKNKKIAQNCAIFYLHFILTPFCDIMCASMYGGLIMKQLLSFMVLCVVAMPAFAAVPAGTGRRTMQAQMMAAQKKVSADGTNASMASMQIMKPGVVADLSDKSSVRPPVSTTTPTAQEEPQVVIDKREKEKAACIQNNIGVGNTFVWASRYSNTANYAMMIEDVEKPENNVCFVKVDVKSSDSKINVSDIPSVYYEMGRDITCGSWADENKLQQRILDAKKSARTWATVGGAVGGAAIGVASMELFGNKLIGGAVEGQEDESLSAAELFRSQLLVLKGKDVTKYNKFMAALKKLKNACGTSTDKKCTEYAGLYDLLDSTN